MPELLFDKQPARPAGRELRQQARRPAATAATILACAASLAALVLLQMCGWKACQWWPSADLGRTAHAASSDRVLVELFVMSRCPDAVKMETALSDVVLAVHSIIDVELKFIGSLDPNATLGAQCKHGVDECQGNIDELCALAHSGGDLPAFWRFLTCLNRNMDSIGGDAGFTLECASAAGLDTAAFATCATTKEGRGLLRQSIENSQFAGVSTSATLYLAGEKRCVEDGGWRECPGGHTPDDFIRDICAAYRGSQPRPEAAASMAAATVDKKRHSECASLLAALPLWPPRACLADKSGVTCAVAQIGPAHGSAQVRGPASTDGGKDTGDDSGDRGDQDAQQQAPKQNGGEDSNGEDDNDEEEEDDEEEGEDEDDGVVRCVCGERNDGELMIECETCQVWQHTLCMGIRDEAHIPDKYYCEKCHPEDHPYVNSRPKSVVYAEANAMGSSSMMRRSAVIAVAKMTSRDEYQAAAVAGSAATAGGKGGRQAAKRPPKRAESTPAARAARRGSRSRRQTRDPSEELADGSRAEHTGQTASPGASTNGGEESSSSSRARAQGKKRSSSQKAKRSSSGSHDPRGKRRRASDWPLTAISEDPDGAVEGGSAGATDSDGDGAEDVIANIMGKGKGRAGSGRNRSASSVEKPTSAGSGDVFGDHELDARLELTAEAKRRGKSAPGSPNASLLSRSPSPLLKALLYEPVHASPAGRLAKRRRSGAAGRSSSAKHQRMAVSASNSPFFEAGSDFEGVGAEAARGLSLPDQRSAGLAAAASAPGSRKGKAAADDDGADNDGSEAPDEKNGPPRQPQHNHPPLEMDDINGNTIVVPSHLLNNSGRPIYSSAAVDTMCRIHYPHGRASLHDLARRAKQLLEWLGKTQVEYEHERQGWEPTEPDAPAAESPAAAAADLSQSTRPRRLSDAPTSPIGPSDWPDDPDESAPHGAAADAACDEPNPNPNPPRPTLSIMEDLMWRLIRFQETYSS
ncbi:hypothetical protein IWQ57_000003 [Coemansia nantahalensis]|uniref:Uncharacterized protein n=1 Tax=Coemansia nantahalensis TaxID=2789366 RepID=A0ACC1K8E3_9FUNG|nr:hypothetical protein IWQ57_000003 [Coemansia nantahalensis]